MPHDSAPVPQGLLPSQVAPTVQRGVGDYLQTTFAFSDGRLFRALDQLLSRTEAGLFKGPYLSVRLPYRKPDAALEHLELPLDVAPTFKPYLHQLRAFERLASKTRQGPQHTLVTTGTGSGKTECFLYPLLDDCWRRRGEKGIKAIILYPMNALATDQAGRLARMIAGDPRLKGIRAGLYVGDDDGSRHGAKAGMSADSLITDRKAMRKSPPDILLTNYRMLDFLLLRPDDKPLWDKNTASTLRYLVLDELHTYDGAQGSDVACLIRRLRHRLGVPAGEDGFTCVGTSATVASDSGDAASTGADELVAFASQVFGVGFDRDAIIGEERVPHWEFFSEDPDEERRYPDDEDALIPVPGELTEEYCERQAELWFGRSIRDPLEVGDEVVSVDGEAVNGMSSEEFIERMTGAEGTDVVFEVLYQDDDGERVEEVSVTRRFLDG